MTLDEAFKELNNLNKQKTILKESKRNPYIIKTLIYHVSVRDSYAEWYTEEDEEIFQSILKKWHIKEVDRGDATITLVGQQDDFDRFEEEYDKKAPRNFSLENGDVGE